MIKERRDFNIQTDNEKKVYYNYGKYIILDLVTLDYVVTDKEEYNELLDEYRDYLISEIKVDLEEKVQEKIQDVNIVFITGFDCNYDCGYCYQKCYKNIRDKMSKEDLKDIKEFYKSYDNIFDSETTIKTITIMGGEPFLDNNYEFIESVFENFPETKITFTSNGSNILKYRDMIVREKSRIDEVILSVDGNKDLHLKHRNTFNAKFYENIWEGLEFLLELGIRVTINSVYHPEDMKEYPLFFDTLEKHGWMEDKFTVILNLDMEKTENIDGDKTYINMAVESFDRLVELDKRANKLSQGFKNHIERSIFDMIEQGEERKPYKHCDITHKPSYTFVPNGGVVTCLGVDNPKLEVGRFKPEVQINKTSIENIYNRDVRKMVMCKECDYRYFCRGGCIAKNIMKYDSFDVGYCGSWREEDFDKVLERVLDDLIASEIRSSAEIKG